ncbi:MAG: response regulator [Deltaproteobacteria bacterium]|nr:response regulator [Kofleriaceae bacterium]
MASTEIESKRVLLVEDDDDTRELVAELFALLGHECQTAATGSEALAVLEGFEPHIVFVDLGLPDMTGHELAEMIRTTYRPDVAIIVVSGRTQPADVARSMETGIALHLAKPIGYDALRRIVGDATVRNRTPARTRPGRPGATCTPTRSSRR